MGTPFVYLAGQAYRRGADEVLYFMRERPVSNGEPNAFPYAPSSAAPPGTCGPQGFDPECEFTIDAVEVRGFGHRTPYNARILSNALHGLDAPFAPSTPLPDPNGLTHLAARLSAFVAHDVQRLKASVTPRRLRHGFANQSDPENATVLSGVPILEPFDLFNVVPVYTPAGVPEAPAFRTMIVSGPLPETVRRHREVALEFANSATPFVDGDTFYGHSQEALASLRSHNGGQFQFQALSSPQVGPIPPLPVPMLPPSFAQTGLREESEIDGIEAFTPSLLDDRNLSTIGTTAVHVLWLRFHNVQAALCQARHPDVDPASPEGDDLLFDCARRWTLAIYQHIIFDEFIPALTGRPLPRYRGYRPGLNPQSAMEVVLGPLSLHSTPSELVPVARPDGTWDERMHVQLQGQPSPPPGAYPFIGSLFPTRAASAGFYFALAGIPTPLGNPTNPSTPWTLVEDPMAQIMRGLAYFPHEANDLTTIDSQRNIPANYGLDLIANNTFRNQQLGAVNYYEIRELMLSGRERLIYGRPGCPRSLQHADDVDDPVACFEHIAGDSTLAAQVRERLMTPLLGVRAKVKHLPLFTGVLMEPKFPGSIFGATGRALIEDQFRRSRDADRHYYRNQFCGSEQAEVDSYTMARVVRSVVGPSVSVQDDVFHVPPPGFFE
ncbi:peroxidase family protein [Sorangium sp. So ce367]|uniref:peroxidase family protein n=1 Tax=Sorangium sp. So ce367 TaxID=3133305 RepID=UPI003F624AE4